MHRVEYLALALLLAGCNNTEPPTKSEPAAPAASADSRLVQISRFDCAKAEDVSDATSFPWKSGISLWAGGGPGGAAFNADTLSCALEFQTRCARGEADAEVRIGGALGIVEHVKIERAGAQLIRFELPNQRWGQHLDEVSALSERFPYRTATFSAAVTAACETPEAFGPGLGPRLEFADDRHFTAGFASGE